MVVTVGKSSESVEPGLSYQGKFPSDGEHTFLIATRACVRSYPVPDLERPPWKFLIGKSVKLRAMPSGVLLAYPPTPDVRVRDNPLRATSDAAAQLTPVSTKCGHPV